MYPFKPKQTILGTHESGTFNVPFSVCYDEWNNHLIVNDSGNGRIQFLDSKTYRYYSMFGSYGHKPGQFNQSTKLCIQPFTRYLLVCDYKNHRIQVFNINDDNYFFIYQIGYQFDVALEEMNKKGQFCGPRGVDCDEKGNILVAESIHGRIQEFNESGRFLSLFGSVGDSLNEFRYPFDICCDKERHQLLIADSNHYRVCIWSHDSSSKPQYVSHIQVSNHCSSVCIDPLRNNQIYIGTNRNVLVYDSRNHKEPIQIIGTNHVNFVSSICVNPEDQSLLVVDCNDHRIQLF